MPGPESPFNHFKDYYSILGFNGINPDRVSPSMIRRNYDLLVKTNYPDLYTDPRSELACTNRSIELDEARNALGDIDTKRRYDEVYLKYREYQHNRPDSQRGFNEELENVPAVLRELFTLFAKAKRERKLVVNIEELNRKTLFELVAIEGLASEYTGRIKAFYQPELREFSKTIQDKRVYHQGLWKFIFGIRTGNYTEIANYSALGAKLEWEIYKQIFPTGHIFEEKVDLAFHLIEEDHRRNPRTRSGTIVGFNEILDQMR